MTSSSARTISEHLERLTWVEICERFPDQWVVLVDTAWANETDFELGTAVVVAHDPHRRVVSPDVKAAFESHDEVGCFWTGTIRGPSRQLVWS